MGELFSKKVVVFNHPSYDVILYYFTFSCGETWIHGNRIWHYMDQAALSSVNWVTIFWLTCPTAVQKLVAQFTINGAALLGIKLQWVFNCILHSEANFDNITLAHHLEVMEEMVRRDKNRPSVIVWSVANEPNTGEIYARPYFKWVCTHWDYPHAALSPHDRRECDHDLTVIKASLWPFSSWFDLQQYSTKLKCSFLLILKLPFGIGITKFEAKFPV